MPALRELQEQFAAAVLRRAGPEGDANSPERLVPGMGPVGEKLARRFAVYRVNARENFLAALEAAYPVLRQETGPDEFRSLVWSYQLAHPSPSGNLFETGRQLPAFMASALSGSGREYLADLARLEWAVQEAMVAADDHRRFDPGMLAGIPAERHEGLRFRIHPSARLLQLEHRPGQGVFSLWQSFHGGKPAGTVPADAIEYILVRRAGSGVELQRLDATGYYCLDLLRSGGTLKDMVETALLHEPDPDIGAMLARWAAQALITGLRENEEDLK